jgi:hypothetical protein
MDVKLMGVITHKLQKLTQLLTETQLSASTSKVKQKEWDCNPHCHSELHEGGLASCVLTNFRRIAKEAEKKIKDEQKEKSGPSIC